VFFLLGSEIILKNNNKILKIKTKGKIRIDFYFLMLKLVENVARCFVDVDSFE
jgi:hypothetical protein